MASRLLLTLLALLTGLAAQVSPARAAECARAAQVVATSIDGETARASSVPAGLRIAPRRPLLVIGMERTTLRDRGAYVAPAPVLTGIDRAHE